MNGNYFANCFIHYEPYEPLEGESSYDPNLDIPPYLIPDSQYVEEWRENNPKGWKGVSNLICVLVLQYLRIVASRFCFNTPVVDYFS